MSNWCAAELSCLPLTMAESAAVKALFKQHDLNDDGTIDEAELIETMEGIGFSEMECKLLFSQADMNHDGVIKYEEFIAWVFSEDIWEDECAAPHMTQAFELLSKSICDLEASATEEGGDLNAATAKQAEMQEQFVKLLGQCFDHHDTSGTGSLDTERAKFLFTSLVSETGAFMEAIVTISMTKTLDENIKGMIEAMSVEMALPSSTLSDEQKAAFKLTTISSMRQNTIQALKESKKKRKKQLQEYKANKEERDEAAFAIIDVDRTGSIGKEEFLAAFTPRNEKSDRVMIALGFESPKGP